MGTELILQLLKEFADSKLERIESLSFQESMDRFGCDKPDLRIPLELKNIGHLAKNEEFKVFAEPATLDEHKVVALRVPGGNSLSRSQIDGYTDFVGKLGAKGLAYIKVNSLESEDGLQSPILKFLSKTFVNTLINDLSVEKNDLIFFGAGSSTVVNLSMSSLIKKLGQDLKLYTSDWAPCWIIDFPMFEKTDSGLSALHHPFTRPNSTIEELKNDPLAVQAFAYDLVLNGYEIGGGSLRIHDHEMQSAIFEALDISKDEAKNKFGFLLDALKTGCPPHGGIALGLDRIVMLLTHTDNIRDVIAFPKTQSASCLLTDAPNVIDQNQIDELSIEILKEDS